MIGLVMPRDRRLQSDRCLVMGILNATPDSFSDGGGLDGPEALEHRIRDMLRQGADILDVGGESTRPGAEPVEEDEELARVLPVIAAIRAVDHDIPISIDTKKAAVADAALAAGADLVNDVSALGDPGMGDVLRRYGTSIVLMRNQDLQGDVVAACRKELGRIWARAVDSGIVPDRIVLDPGLGFGDPPGTSTEANLALVDQVRRYDLGRPVLIGGSRKRFVGEMTGETDPKKRVAGSVEVAVRAARAGAAIVRVHDVAETVAALKRI